MKTDLDGIYRHLGMPTIFRPEFNQAQSISVTQAWSLFFTGGQDVNSLGTNSELGQFLTNILLAVVFTGAIGSLTYFQGA